MLKKIVPVGCVALLAAIIINGCASTEKQKPKVTKKVHVNKIDVNKVKSELSEKVAKKKTKKKMPNGLYALMKTSKGLITIKLFYKKVPLTVCNFVALAEGKMKTRTRSSRPFYDGLTFHRVIKDFMIQGGDPQGTGRGGPGYSFPDEFDVTLRHNAPGIVSMANSGPDSNGSQFFITHKETPWLDDKHSIFGKVVKGMDVVNKIQQGDKIISVKILREGKDAKKFEADQEAFNKLLKMKI